MIRQLCEVLKNYVMNCASKLPISRRHIFVLIFIIIVIYTWNAYTFVYYDGGHQLSQHLKYINVFHEYSTKRQDLKYVLQWTTSNVAPFLFMGRGQEGFIKRNCPVQNCFMTDDRLYFRDVKDFDVVLFNGPELHRSYWTFPTQRAPYQIYTFVSTESSDNYPICQPSFDYFFNRTWTYKLDSDIPFNYIIITNKRYQIIGPKREMHWIDINKMLPINDSIKARLAKKTKAAAWFVSNCYAVNDRDTIAKSLKDELKKYGLQLDIYGKCGDMICEKYEQKQCSALVERDYYFYLAFENSFSEDYVTEKLLTALQHYSVPVVYGAANYSRFDVIPTKTPSVKTQIVNCFLFSLYSLRPKTHYKHLQ